MCKKFFTHTKKLVNIKPEKYKFKTHVFTNLYTHVFINEIKTQ